MMMTVVVMAALQTSALPVQAKVEDGSRRPAIARPAAKPIRTGARTHLVVIDAGHGGRDVGGPVRSGARIHEKDITLQVALKLGEELKTRGVDVWYTRKTDTLIALDDRGRLANQAHGDVFISIHVNAANPRWRQPTAARGFETYFLATARTEDAQRVEEMENESIRFESEGDSGVASGDPLSFILSDMMQNEHLRESSDLAELVQRHLKQVHPGPNRGVKQAGFRVLINAFMPAVLVELGFGTNADEARFMASTVKQRTLAKAIADATVEYLERYQKRVGSGAASGAHE
jgi:N-acetylmuramoyl-L-alanine amidase